jgi:hypothetical protein
LIVISIISNKNPQKFKEKNLNLKNKKSKINKQTEKHFQRKFLSTYLVIVQAITLITIQILIFIKKVTRLTSNSFIAK